MAENVNNFIIIIVIIIVIFELLLLLYTSFSQSNSLGIFALNFLLVGKRE